MRRPAIPIIATVPLFLYVTYLAVSTVNASDAWLIFAAVVAALPLVRLVVPVPWWLVGMPIGFVLGVCAVDFAFPTDSGAPLFPSGIAFSMAAGLIVGIPLWLVGILLTAKDRTATPIAILADGVFLGLFVAAARAALSTESLPVDSAKFVSAFLRVDHDQAMTLGSLAVGFTPSSIPLGSVADPLLLALAAAAFVGLFASWIAPTTLGPSKLVESLSYPDPARTDLGADISPAHRLKVAQATPGQSPGLSQGFAVVPLLAAGIATAAFLALTTFATWGLLIGLTLSLAVTYAVIGFLHHRVSRLQPSSEPGIPARGQTALPSPRTES